MTFLLVHGNAGSAQVWTRVREALAPDLSLAPDLPGFGAAEEAELSGAVAVDDVLRAYVDPVDRVLALAAEPVVAVGNGVGSILVAHLARLRPGRVRGVVMTGPVGLPGGHARLGRIARTHAGASILRRTGRTVGRARFLRDQLARPDDDPEAAGILLDALRRARGFHLLARLNRRRVLSRLVEVTCPIVVLWGEEDGVLPVRFAAEFMSRLPPHARLETVPGAGHALPLERPDLVARIVRGLG